MSCKVYSEFSILTFPNARTIQDRFNCVALTDDLKYKVALTFAKKSIPEDKLDDHVWKLIPFCSHIGGAVDRAVVKAALVDCVRLTRSDFQRKWFPL